MRLGIISVLCLALTILMVSTGCSKKSDTSGGGGGGTGGAGTPSSDSSKTTAPAVEKTPTKGEAALLVEEFADDILGVDPPTAEGIDQMLEEQEIILNTKPS